MTQKINFTRFFTLLAIFLLQLSCSERGVENPENTNNKGYASKTPPIIICGPPCAMYVSTIGSTIIPEARSTSLNNGITITCAKNILIFPTLASYQNAITTLDAKIDAHNDAFDKITAGMTDDEADAYADSVGFDEDKPLTDFENELQFCSLRKKMLTLEDQWLDLQVDGAWNQEQNPDNHYVDDDAERALLSEGSEVIIGDCTNGFQLYKMYEWGYVVLPTDDLVALSTTLTRLNNNSNPSISPINIHGSTIGAVETILNNSPLSCVATKGVCPQIIVESNNNTGSSCRDHVKEKGEYVFNSERRIQWKHKFKWAQFPSSANEDVKIKMFTKSYKKKRGKWKIFRATIYAGYEGDFSDTNCNIVGGTPHGKEKRRKRLKYKDIVPGFAGQTVSENKVFSVHKQEGGGTYTNDIY